ncbi:hypothetical protein ACFQ0G_53490 [Streptomyces chiangmaiensis]|uniref:hypothetical protein n=1 Tax=Streptomyces chiangmaiensis TaxID=766497 RepID=UPI0031E4FE81
MNQVLAAIQHLLAHDADPADRAAVYDRKAALLERIATEDGRPEAAEDAPARDVLVPPKRGAGGMMETERRGEE